MFWKQKQVTAFTLLKTYRIKGNVQINKCSEALQVL